MLLTPWFAVSAGIVIAASLALVTPHAALTFPPPVSGHCARADCGAASGTPQGRAGRQPATKRGVKLQLPRSGARSRTVTDRQGQVSVDYETLAERPGHFSIMIMIVARRSLGSWQLSFALHGGHVEDVLAGWAKWRRAGRDGLVVYGSPAPWPRSGDNRATIVVFGAGSPGRPAGCVFDGAACTFHAISRPRHGWPHGWRHWDGFSRIAAGR